MDSLHNVRDILDEYQLGLEMFLVDRLLMQSKEGVYDVFASI